jgi:O-antigen/teichoic acid export membrane protein
LAIYIAASQLAVGGVHISVLRSVAQTPAESAEQSAVIASGLALTLALGCVVAALVWLTRGFWAWALDSQPVGDSLAFVAPALVFFALSKTLLATFNGLERMRVFAVLQALRFVTLISVLALLAWRRHPAHHLSASLLISEICVTLAASVCLGLSRPVRISSVRQAWIRHHLAFGARGLLSGVFIELNTRIDVLLIGAFSSDRDAGRYTLAAVFAEGLYQCLVVVKNQMNPVLARLLLAKQATEVVSLVRRAWPYLYPGIAAVYLLGLLVLYVLAENYLGVSDPGEVIACYAILGLGVLAVAGFVPFDGVLTHAGKPEFHTLLTFLIVATNALLNVALIPPMGIVGAALATASTLVISILYLSVLMRWQLNFSYLTRR